MVGTKAAPQGMNRHARRIQAARHHDEHAHLRGIDGDVGADTLRAHRHQAEERHARAGHKLAGKLGGVRHARERGKGEQRRRRVEHYDGGHLERGAAQDALAHIVEREQHHAERGDEAAVHRAQKRGGGRQQHAHEQERRHDDLNHHVGGVALEEELAAHGHEHGEARKPQAGDKRHVEEGPQAGEYERTLRSRLIAGGRALGPLAGRALIATQPRHERHPSSRKRERHEQRDRPRLAQEELGPACKRGRHGRGGDHPGGLAQVVSREDARPGHQLAQAAQAHGDAHRPKCPLGQGSAQGHAAEHGVSRRKEQGRRHARRQGTQQAGVAQAGHEGSRHAGGRSRAQRVVQDSHEIGQRLEALERHGRSRVDEQRRQKAREARRHSDVCAAHAPRPSHRHFRRHPSAPVSSVPL